MSGWTDYWPDWSSADALRLCPVSDALAAIVAAINERVDPLSSLFWWAGWEYTPVPDPLSPTITVCRQIDNIIRRMFSRFVARTAGESGDFSGMEVIPTWTDSAMAAALGEDSLIPIVQLEDLRPWIYQQYQIINLLRYVLDVPSEDFLLTADYRDTDKMPWEQAVSEFFAQTPNPVLFAPPYYGAGHYGMGNTGIALLTATYSKSYSVECLADYYIKPTKSSAAQYQPLKYAPAPDLFWLHKSIQLPGVVEVFFPDIDDLAVPLTEPTEENPAVSCRLSARAVVLKFDGENGFKFRGDDW